MKKEIRKDKYIMPQADVFFVQSEEVLCESGASTGTLDPLDEGTWNW